MPDAVNQQKGWKFGLRGLALLGVTLFLIALLRRWLLLPFAGAAAMFVTQVAFYWAPQRPVISFWGWLRICLVISALVGVGFYLISFIGGADNIPTL